MVTAIETVGVWSVIMAHSELSLPGLFFTIAGLLASAVFLIYSCSEAGDDSWKTQPCVQVCGEYSFGVTSDLRRTRCEWCLERDRRNTPGGQAN